MKVVLNWKNGEENNYYSGIPNQFSGVKSEKHMRVYNIFDNEEALLRDIQTLSTSYMPIVIEKF